ncbi:RND family transporter [Pseudomonas sp. PD9R]|uniref:efflux RND transporter permease subunit n=1 Tax=Pseudomonas sp. PD9R TaxID=2853534 RepID=UPI001C48AF56|nr:MMPL family transporter [Pseudomonas sp. PD9R]MBV6822038.1 MMPL family transporter [Pseudomonas sp. PD9R]
MNAHHVFATDDAELIAQRGSWVERLLFGQRSLFVLLCLLATCWFGYKATGLELNAAFEKMLPSGHPYILNYLENRSQLAGAGNTLRIAVEARKGTIFDAEYLEAVKKITDELFLLPAVDRPYMKSLWTPAMRWTAVTEDGLDGGPVIPDNYDGSAQSLAQVRQNVERSGEIGQLVADDYKSSIILVPLQEQRASGAPPIDYQALSQRLETLRATYSSAGIDIHITGFAKLVGDLIAGMRQVMVFFLVAAAICLAVLFWYTRCIRSALVVLSCSLVAVVWLLGALASLGFVLDPYLVLVPFLVFAVGLSHGAQKMNGITQDIGRGVDRLTAAQLTFRRLFLVGLSALVCDVVGFAVLMVIDIPVIKDLAICASIGVMILIVTNLMLLPVLLSFIGVSESAARRAAAAAVAEVIDVNHVKHPAWAFLDHFTQRRWAGFALLGAAVLALVGVGYSTQLKIGDTNPGAPELRADSQYNRDNAFMVGHYSASSDVYVVMVKTPQFACALYDTVRTVDRLAFELSRVPGVEGTKSLAGLAKTAATGMNEGSLKWYEIPRNQDMLNAIITRAPREMFNQNCDLLSVYVYLRDHKADTLSGVVNAVEDFARRNNSADYRFLNAAGNAGIEAATNIVVKEANRKMLFLVYAAVIIISLVTFRSWRAVVCAVVPLMLTSVLCEALMVWLNIGVKVATLPVIALGVGIGVDYALYIMTVMLRYLREGASLSEAYYRALVFTGKIVVLTGATLGIAVATWYFSPIKFQADMGILLAFMFVWNMLGALILLPALAYFLFRPGKMAAAVV